MVGLGMLRNRLEKEIEDIVQNAELNGEPIERRGRDGDENVYNLMLSPKGNSVLTRKVILDEVRSSPSLPLFGNSELVGSQPVLRRNRYNRKHSDRRNISYPPRPLHSKQTSSGACRCLAG